jgi:hypothetical protein
MVDAHRRFPVQAPTTTWGDLGDLVGERYQVTLDGTALGEFAIDVHTARAALADEEVSALAAVGVEVDRRAAGPQREPTRGASSWRRRVRDHRPFTGGAKGVLRRALEEAQGLGHRHLGPEHILMALTETSAVDPGLRLLRRLGVEPEVLRRALSARLTRAPGSD